MTSHRTCPAALLLTAATALALPAASAGETDWPMFRGTQSAGVQDGKPLPAEWNVPDGRNVAWKREIPGLGLASPVIWGDNLFVVTAVSQADNELRVGLYGDIAPVQDDSVHEWLLFCLDRKTGAEKWKRLLHRGVPAIRRHTKASHANSTPATDGKHVVVMLGSEGLFCLDMQGDLLWQKDLGVLDAGYYAVPAAQWGFASSPAIHDDRVVVQCDVNGDSFLACFALPDGRELWRTARNDVPTWSTPTIHAGPARTQVICNGWHEVAGYDLASGKELWTLSGGGDIPVPTPVIGPGLVYITNAHGALAPLYAIALDASGDISLSGGASSNEGVRWSYAKRGNYMQTPLVYGDLLYTCRDNGVVSIYDARSGERHSQERIGSGSTGFTASPVAGDGKVYFTSEVGDVHVFAHDKEARPLAVNPLGENCMATPAISDGALYFRTQKHVIAVR